VVFGSASDTAAYVNFKKINDLSKKDMLVSHKIGRAAMIALPMSAD
jgi:hypothetical protein